MLVMKIIPCTSEISLKDDLRLHWLKRIWFLRPICHPVWCVNPTPVDLPPTTLYLWATLTRSNYWILMSMLCHVETQSHFTRFPLASRPGNKHALLKFQPSWAHKRNKAWFRICPKCHRGSGSGGPPHRRRSPHSAPELFLNSSAHWSSFRFQ